jgi:hypothetical protein
MILCLSSHDIIVMLVEFVGLQVIGRERAFCMVFVIQAQQNRNSARATSGKWCSMLYVLNGVGLRVTGRDRAFRMFSVIQDQQSRELSQGHIGKRAKRLRLDQAELKLPPLTSLAARQV